MDEDADVAGWTRLTRRCGPWAAGFAGLPGLARGGGGGRSVGTAAHPSPRRRPGLWPWDPKLQYLGAWGPRLSLRPRPGRSHTAGAPSSRWNWLTERGFFD